MISLLIFAFPRSRLLPQEGRLLRCGDATGDNEVDEDDVNAVDDINVRCFVVDILDDEY